MKLSKKFVLTALGITATTAVAGFAIKAIKAAVKRANEGPALVDARRLYDNMALVSFPSVATSRSSVRCDDPRQAEAEGAAQDAARLGLQP
jgi:hypothetical protein